jgi:hypothetical protein
MIRSALGTDIVWRQIRYKLISPNETRVLGGSAAAPELQTQDASQERLRN